MGDSASAGQAVASPTYMNDIRGFFRPKDVQHMAGMGIELGTYEGVKSHAIDIYAQTQAGLMPRHEPAARWSAERLQTFLNWITNGYPLGTATPTLAEAEPADAPGGRQRKNVTTLSSDEIARLKAAFQGIMDLKTDDPNSYFALAGIHGLPQAYCMHHVNAYNPWHRTYLKIFEDALRSVPGCEDVTLPYWDISTRLPDLLNDAPFANYVLPEDPGASDIPPVGGYFPLTTSRADPDTIMQLLGPAPQGYDVLTDIGTSLDQSLWGVYNVNGYQDFSIQAHDGGHGAIGGGLAGLTMGDQNVASYDPVFWFFHCNLDRLWLSWQVGVGAATLTGFRSTVTGDATWLSPPLNALPPWDTTSDQTIEFGISYDKLEPVGGKEVRLENATGSLEAARSFSIKRSAPVSVRVKGIDRLAIPGSFEVNLLADGEPVAKRFFFQPTQPQNCENCKTLALANIDFRIDQEKILDRKLSVEIHVPSQKEIGTQFPLSQAGNPTINARLLLADE
jgi:hypothetical protein